MISVIYCTRETNPEHKEHLIKSSGLHKHIEVIEIINNGESLTKSYNRGLKQAKNNIVVFCHDDIVIETKQWGTKLIKQFNRNPEYGIIGVAGTKQMPSSGQWWENRKKMYGRVAHTHEGKTWLSSYSDDLGQNIEEVVSVDGVFFAVDKSKLKHQFNESVEGFHFYEITFCFENFLDDIKIGVTTLIRINHKSIGMTNEQWEENRKIFAEKYKEKLPVNIKKTLKKGQKLKIILVTTSLPQNGVREKIILELANQLKIKGHDVILTSIIDGPLVKTANKNGVKLCPIQEPPSFKLGDGKWELKTVNGLVPSVEKTLYKIKEINYDVIHLFNDELIAHFDKLYSGTPLVNTRFLDGLFVQNTDNPLIVKTIDLKSDFDDIKNLETINNILATYVDVL